MDSYTADFRADSSSSENLPTPPPEHDEWSDSYYKVEPRSTPVSPRRQRVASRAVSSPLRSRPRPLMSNQTKTTPTKRPRGRPRKETGTSESKTPGKHSNALLADTLHGSSAFLLDVLSNTLWMVRKPISWFLALYLVAVFLAIGYRYASNAVFAALAPLCNIPGVSKIELPFCHYQSDASYRPFDGGKGDFPKLIEVQSDFGEVLENSVSGSTLALDLKNSEVAVRDLNALVRVSDLLCRDELSKRLNEFVDSAKTTGRSLTKFGAGVNGVVDQLLAMDEYAIKGLEQISEARVDSSTEPSVLSLALAPFRSTFNIAHAEQEIASTFLQASGFMDRVIKKLVLEAEEALRDLELLENKLLVIYEIVRREEAFTKDQQGEVLAEIWTIVGGNKKKLSNFSFNLALLTSIRGYREKALKYVSSSLLQLLQMQADLEELRDRVAQPALLADAGLPAEIPIEVHIQSIRKGVDRLQAGMDAAQKKEKEHIQKLLYVHDTQARLEG